MKQWMKQSTDTRRRRTQLNHKNRRVLRCAYSGQTTSAIVRPRFGTNRQEKHVCQQVSVENWKRRNVTFFYPHFEYSAPLLPSPPAIPGISPIPIYIICKLAWLIDWSYLAYRSHNISNKHGMPWDHTTNHTLAYWHRRNSYRFLIPGLLFALIPMVLWDFFALSSWGNAWLNHD